MLRAIGIGVIAADGAPIVSFLAFDYSGGVDTLEEKAKNRFSREGLSVFFALSYVTV
jgi:hypothetical protein